MCEAVMSDGYEREGGTGWARLKTYCYLLSIPAILLQSSSNPSELHLLLFNEGVREMGQEGE